MNDNFENSIRKKLQEADFPFDQDAWKQMENLLNKDKDRKRPLWWWILPLSAILISLLFLLPRNENQQPLKTASNQAAENTVTSSNQHVDKVSPTISQHENHGSERLSSPKNTISTPLHSAITSTQKTTITNNTKQTTYTNDFNHDNVEIAAINSYNVNEYTKINESAVMPVKSNITSDSLKDTSVTYAKRKFRPKLFVGITAGPDFNTTASFRYSAIGFNAGVILHYYFKPRWFITAGAVYNKKIYDAAGTEYKSNYYDPNDEITKVNANCDVLDIPLNINYAFVKNNKHSIAALLGSSSYFMLKEKYYYDYEYGTDKTVEIRNQNRNYFAVLNAGILYQQPVGNRLILGVQPYVKIPITGVGAGQVKLVSTGISLQLTLTGRKH
ncbi:MAG: PorT family protein [Chitinophaga sp.]|uniref:porin family protein n=1 Tax=Chitinophaga sp. TaxID=1869181 RepID=UPI0025C4A994|nr:porin family protein [Chitinophaga sp.]MBV8254662.1 PorT family protein [Chitinophaga sp.]